MRLINPGDGASAVSRYLLPHENQVITMRQHPFALLPSAATFVGSLIVAMSAPVISHGRHLSVAIAWSLTALLALELLLAIVRWSKSYLVITNQRLLVFSGRFPNNVNIMPLDGLKGMSVHRSLSGRVIGYGTLVHEGRPIYRFLVCPEEINLELQGYLFPRPARGE